MRWLGASMRLTGMNGAFETVLIAEVSGRSGNGDLGSASSLDTGLLWPLPGVEGHEDRIRGVPLMA
jgi:hypothetical protein